jgi:hypothetical protein
MQICEGDGMKEILCVCVCVCVGGSTSYSISNTRIKVALRLNVAHKGWYYLLCGRLA